MDQPIGTRPLRQWIKPGDRVCILFTDITRATPNERLIPWILEYLKDVPREQITLLNQLGTHRPNTTVTRSVEENIRASRLWAEKTFQAS